MNPPESRSLSQVNPPVPSADLSVAATCHPQTWVMLLLQAPKVPCVCGPLVLIY